MADPVPGMTGTKAPPDAPTEAGRLPRAQPAGLPIPRARRGSEATRQEPAHHLIGSAPGVHWPDVGENIGVEGMLRGVRAHPQRSTAAPKRDGAVRGQEPPNKRIQPTRVKR